jgi:para-nitrobenzyl esterase
MSRSFNCNYNYPVAETSAGKLRGFKLDSTYIFKGVKYAQAKRFMQPEPVKPWSGIKEAVEYGYVCPLLDPESPMGDLLIPHRFWPKSEDCLSLNLWTQSLDVNAKKPVMVWLHGGGFSTGSSIEMVAYDGENLSRYGDVVVVSINHRLNILGYMRPVGLWR